MNKALLLPLAMFLGLALVHGPALAMPGAGKSSAESFQKMDADKDGKVSKEEFSKAHPGMKESTFGVLDKNGDGCLTQEEWDSFMQGHGAMNRAFWWLSSPLIAALLCSSAWLFPIWHAPSSAPATIEC